jgi:hypothetical protein
LPGVCVSEAFLLPRRINVVDDACFVNRRG